MNNEQKGIFRLSCCIEESEKMIDWINERSNQITEDFDLPITDVNLVTFLIKVYVHSFYYLVLLSIITYFDIELS